MSGIEFKDLTEYQRLYYCFNCNGQKYPASDYCEGCKFLPYRGKKLIEDRICPDCGSRTKFNRHESDHGLCGGIDRWTTEDCPKCGRYNIGGYRKRLIEYEKELKKQKKYEEKLKYYNEYLKPYIEEL